MASTFKEILTLKSSDNEMFKTIGICVIIILAIARFIVYPLHGYIAKKKVVFNEFNDAFRIKEQHFTRQSMGRQHPTNARIVKKDVAPYVYERELPFSSVQAEVIDAIVKIAEKKGLSVQNYEMLEATTGKMISDVPIRISLAGKPEDLLAVLKSIVSEGKAVQIKNLEMSKRADEMTMMLALSAFRLER